MKTIVSPGPLKVKFCNSKDGKCEKTITFIVEEEKDLGNVIFEARMTTKEYCSPISCFPYRNLSLGKTRVAEVYIDLGDDFPMSVDDGPNRFLPRFIT